VKLKEFFAHHVPVALPALSLAIPQLPLLLMLFSSIHIPPPHSEASISPQFDAMPPLLEVTAVPLHFALQAGLGEGFLPVALGSSLREGFFVPSRPWC